MHEQTHQATIGDCAACGTSPVNHRLFFTMSVVDGILERTMGTLFGWIKVPREGRFVNIVIAGLVGFFWLLGLARFSTDRSKAASGRSELIWEEAARRGIRMEQIVMFGKYLEQYRAKLGGRWIYFQSIPVPYWLPQDGYAWLDDKFKLSERLRKAGVGAPRAAHVSTWRGARKAFEKLDKPLIIKPRSGSRGRHTTTNINTKDELRLAYDLARQIAPSLVVEEHLYGSVYRATIVDRTLSGFFRADPPQVAGDGTHTVRELIAEKNKNRSEKLQDIQITDDLLSFISRKGYSLESVVPAGTTLDLSAKTGRFYGGYTKEMLPEVHPKMHAIFKKAGEVIEASIVGFDLIIPDPTVDPDTQKWGIIEANSLPFIDLHYYPLEGTPIDISKNIWDLWEAKFKK
jgi:cyanophycin synthetase